MMNKKRIIGIVMLVVGLIINFTLSDAYGFVSGGLIGAGLGLALFFGPKSSKKK